MKSHYEGRPLREVLDGLGIYRQAEAACKKNFVTLAEVERRCRQRCVVRARVEVWRLMHSEGLSMSHIARIFGLDHTSVVHGLRNKPEVQP